MCLVAEFHLRVFAPGLQNERRSCGKQPEIERKTSRADCDVCKLLLSATRPSGTARW